MIYSISPSEQVPKLENVPGPIPKTPATVAGSLLHVALLLAQADTGFALPRPADLRGAVDELLDSLMRTRRALARTRQRGNGYWYRVVDGAGKAVALPLDGRLFAHLCDTTGEDGSAYFYGLLRRDPTDWLVDASQLKQNATLLLVAYSHIHAEAADALADPAIVEYQADEDDRGGSLKPDFVAGLDLPVPNVVDLKTSLGKQEPADFDEWRASDPGSADKLDRYAQLVADDYRRPTRRAVLYLSGRTGRGAYLVDFAVSHPNNRPDDAEGGAWRRRGWLRSADQDWLYETSSTWVDPALFARPNERYRPSHR